MATRRSSRVAVREQVTEAVVPANLVAGTGHVDSSVPEGTLPSQTPQARDIPIDVPRGDAVPPAATTDAARVVPPPPAGGSTDATGSGTGTGAAQATQEQLPEWQQTILSTQAIMVRQMTWMQDRMDRMDRG